MTQRKLSHLLLFFALCSWGMSVFSGVLAWDAYEHARWFGRSSVVTSVGVAILQIASALVLLKAWAREPPS